MGVSATAGAITLKEAREMIREGKALKLPHDGFAHRHPSGITEAPEAMGTDRLRPHDGTPLLKKLPKRVTAGGSDLYAWTNYSNGSTPGLYSVDASGIKLKWADPLYAATVDDLGSYSLSAGYLDDGVITESALWRFWGTIFAGSKVKWDFKTGEVLSEEELDSEVMPCFYRLAYNPEDDCIYGTGLYVPYDGGNSTLLMKAPADDWSQVEVLGILSYWNQLTAMCFNSADGCLYGINLSDEFVRISLDGEITPLFALGLTEIGLPPGFYTGLVYSPVENLYYFSPMAEIPPTYDYVSYIATIDPVTETVNLEYELPGHEQILQLFTTDETVVHPEQPSRPSLVERVFMQGSTSGWCVYEMPSTLSDGTPIEGELRYNMLLDGEVYKTGSARPGQQVRVVYKDMSEGLHKFGCYVEAGGHSSRTTSREAWIGFDTPTAPANVRIEGDRLTWDPVYTSENGGYVNYSDVVYNVSFNGQTFEGIAGTELTLRLPEDTEMAIYEATVTACYRGHESDGTRSNGIVSGSPLSLPVHIVPTEEQAAICSVVNANNDDMYWGYSEKLSAFLISRSMGHGANDDWLVLPPVKLENAGHYISITFDVAIGSPKYPKQKIGVYLGTSNDPVSMTRCIMEPFTPMDGKSSDFQHVQAIFKCEEAGPYYIGFHDTSASEQLGIVLKNITIRDNNITDKSPSTVSALTAEAAGEGALSATVSFTMPTTDMLGHELAADAELTATVTTLAETKTVNGTPGSRHSIELSTVQSTNEISVFASDGALNSPDAIVYVYTGVYPPATPELTSVVVSDDMQSMTIHWNPVTEPAQPGTYVGDNIAYTTYEGVDDGLMGIEWIELESGLTECSYTYHVAKYAPMQFRKVGVVSYNEAGNNGSLIYAQGLVGTPYTLPIENDFTVYYSGCQPWIYYRPTDDFTGTWDWFVINDFGDYDYNVHDEFKTTIGATGAPGSKAGISIPRFTTKNEETATVVIRYWADCTVTLDAMWSGQHEAANIPLCEINGDGSGFHELVVTLPAELMDKDWVQVNIICSFTGVGQTFLLPYVAVTDRAPEGGSSHVDGMAPSTGIFGGKGIITVRGLEGSNVTISGIDGTVVLRDVAGSDNAVYTLDRGVYVVKAGSEKAKVIVE